MLYYAGEVANMFQVEMICSLCEQYSGVSFYYPFGETPKCYRVGGKIFAEVYPGGVPGALRILLEDETIERERMVPMVTLRCEPAQGDFYRQQYPSFTLRPYHTPPAQQPYANTILLESNIPEGLMEEMVAHSYTVVFKRLPKKLQQSIGLA